MELKLISPEDRSR